MKELEEFDVFLAENFCQISKGKAFLPADFSEIDEQELKEWIENQLFRKCDDSDEI